jgi:hypothetical protein
MTLRGRDILTLIAPATLWAVHFVAIYALISAACAPRAVIGVTTAQIAGGVATVLALALALLAVLRPMPETGLATALRWAAAIAAAAILLDGAFLFFFDTCGG